MIEKAKKIKMIILDVDGTLTDGKIYIDSNHLEIKAFNVKDGFAVSSAVSLGMHFAIITGRRSKIVEKRAEELGVRFVYQKIKNKKAKLKELLEESGISLDETAYIGDDINDLPAMKMVGLKGATFDSAQEVKEIADFISNAKGGDGAVREFVEFILRAQDKWQDVIERFEFRLN